MSMRIYPIINNHKNYRPYNTPQNTPSKQDIAFGAMKKSQFSGIDLVCIEKFKAPIEKFNKNEDLQNWAKQKLDLILNKDYGGRQIETIDQRISILHSWKKYIEQNNTSSTGGLLILSSITKGLTNNSDKIPPILHHNTIKEIMTRINNGEDININKAYQAKLKSMYMNFVDSKKPEAKWIQIPSEEHDPQNYEKNIDKLKILSFEKWCTHSFRAAQYLKEGDFHIYFVNNKPAIGIRFKDGIINEIQGIKNDNQIPPQYYEEVKKHVKNYKKTLKVKGYMYHAKHSYKVYKKEQAAFAKVKKDLNKAIATKDYGTIFDYLDLSINNKKDNIFSRVSNKIKKIISGEETKTNTNATTPIKLKSYTQPGNIEKLHDKGLSRNITFKDLEIDENELFKNVTEIEGNADFFNSNLTSLHNLEKIHGNATFSNSPLKNLEKLKYIGGCAYFNSSSITSLKALEEIGGDAIFINSPITSLEHLKKIGGNALFNSSSVKDLGELQTINGYINCENSPLAKFHSLFWENYRPD